jgi:hypothetical protein
VNCQRTNHPDFSPIFPEPYLLICKKDKEYLAFYLKNRGHSRRGYSIS